MIKSQVSNLKYEHCQNCNVYIKNTIQRQATFALPWTIEGEKAS